MIAVYNYIIFLDYVVTRLRYLYELHMENWLILFM